MRTIKLLITLVLLGLSYNSFAQCAYGIPPPCVPANDPGWGGGGGGGYTPSAPQQRWVYTWGAVAQDKEGPVGVSTGYDSKRQAEKAAIKDCHERGGDKCKVLVSYHHQCVAMAVGKGVYLFRGPNQEENEQEAIRGCNNKIGDGECRIYYSNCTKAYLK